jgi:hypothetical protein
MISFKIKIITIMFGQFSLQLFILIIYCLKIFIHFFHFLNQFKDV